MIERVKVGPFNYSISLSDDDKKSTGNPDDSWGKIDYGTLEITIHNKLSPQKLKEILIHEIVHAILHYTAIKEDLSDGVKISNEQFTTRITPALLALIRENPDLISYIVSE